MTHGAFLSVAAVFAILAAVFALAVLSSLALRADGLSGRRGGAVLGVPGGTWLLAVIACGRDTVDWIAR